MPTKIRLTLLQLTLAQLGKCVLLNTGETLSAFYFPWGEWKYTLTFEGVTSAVRYAPYGSGLEDTEWALNASDDEMSHEWGV